MLYRISKPVLGIFGTSSRQGKYSLQLTLRHLLTTYGYNVGQIGTEPTALLFEMDYAFPMGYNSSVHIHELDVVRFLNSIVNDLCMKNKDIIIVGSQSGTVTYDVGNEIQYCFPQYSFLLGTQPDAIVLCINPYDEIEFIKRTIGFLESSVNNCKVIAMVVFPMDIADNWFGAYGAKKPIVPEKYKKLKEDLQNMFYIPVFKLGDENDMRMLVQDVINYFQNE